MEILDEIDLLRDTLPGRDKGLRVPQQSTRGMTLIYLSLTMRL